MRSALLRAPKNKSNPALANRSAVAFPIPFVAPEITAFILKVESSRFKFQDSNCLYCQALNLNFKPKLILCVYFVLLNFVSVNILFEVFNDFPGNIDSCSLFNSFQTRG